MKRRKGINYSQIRTIEDLHRHKILLEKKISVRKRLLNKHISDLSDDFSAEYLFRESVKTLKIKNPLVSLAPQLFKNKDVFTKKGFILPLVSGLGAAIGSLFLFKNNPFGQKKMNR